MNRLLLVFILALLGSCSLVNAWSLGSLLNRARNKKPVLEINILLPSSSDNLSLFDSETVDEAVERFIQAHEEARPHASTILDQVRRRAIKAQLLPLFSVPVAPDAAPDQAVFTVDIFEGDDLEAVTREVAEQQRLEEHEVQQVIALVRRRGVELGLIPLMSIQVTLDNNDRHETLALFRNANISTVVHDFAAKHQLGDQEASRLIAQVESHAKREGLLPIMSLHAQLKPQDGEAVPLQIDFMHNEDLDKTIALYAKAYNLTEEAVAMLRQTAEDKAKALRLLPVLSVPAELNGKPLVLTLYAGDQPEQVVDRFIRELALNVSSSDREAIVGAVRAYAIDRRVLPAMQLEITLPTTKEDDAGRGQQKASFILFRGDPVDKAIEAFATRHDLPRDVTDRLRTEVTTRAAAQGLVPALSVPIQIDGATFPLELFRGDNVTASLLQFSAAHDLTQEQRASLEASVLRRATAARLVPVLTLDVELGDKTIVPLSMYDGDSAEDAVQAFAQKFALTSVDAETLLRSVRLAAVRRRLAPILRVPVKVANEQGGDAPPRSIDFSLWEGDSLPDRAKEFIHEHQLPVNVNDFVASIEQHLQTNDKEDKKKEL